MTRGSEVNLLIVPCLLSLHYYFAYLLIKFVFSLRDSSKFTFGHETFSFGWYNSKATGKQKVSAPIIVNESSNAFSIFSLMHEYVTTNNREDVTGILSELENEIHLVVL